MPALGEEVRGEALREVPERSVPHMLALRAAVEPGRVAVRSRNAAGRWVDLTWAQLEERRRALAAALIGLGVHPGDRVALVAPNSVEMLVAEMAILTAGAVSAPVFPDYNQDLLLHCLNDSGARVAFAGSALQQHRITPSKGIERIVVLDDQPLEDPRAMPLKALDHARPAELPARDRGDLAFLLYTSGTTGRPRGVELTHWNVLSQQAAIGQVWNVSRDDIFLSYLPWHHCFGSLFERMMALWHRATLVLDDSRGRDLAKLIANWREVKPTVYFSVPRVFSALRDAALKDPAARAALLHDRLRFVFSAAAPLPQPLFRFFEDARVPVLEGWGLTETSPCVTVSTPSGAREAGVVGFPLPGTSVKLEPVSDLPHGEVLVRGEQVMRGYRNLPHDTGRAMRDGWFHSGDLASWTASGLRLAGRIDGVFKLQNGEKVSSAEVEARMVAATPLIEQALAVGAGQPFVAALCWISPAAARRFLEERQLEAPADLVSSPEVRRAIVEALQAANLLARVPYERVRRVALVGEAPSLENGQLTPTSKLVRGTITNRQQALIAALADEAPHPAVLEIVRRGDPFGNA
ncbi:MAG TPA: AMP-binding protein [Myxococcales bacterium]|nr:AMP-binding protein [Myxococcales bacterium]